MNGKVEIIEQKRYEIPRRLRVAAYARVSCGKDTMLYSLAAQIDYYRNMIRRNLEWIFAGVFADEAKTGTKADRPQFQELLHQCRAGGIDMIITKSISRFARNTVTLLSTVRELKDLGVDVFFEEQNIHTIGAEGELLLTLLAAFAQAESLSVSENCKWRIRNGFEEGHPTAFRMLGYRLKDGEVTVVPEETETVQRIFELYLQGYGTQRIANTLNEEGHRTVNGGLWWPTTIGRIIGNEKYSGDLLLQKFFVPDHLSKAKHFNTGELPIHTVEDNHEAIIEKPMFRQAAARQRARSFQRETKQTHSALTGMICCACCGRSYNRKTTTGGVKWCCVTYNARGKTACPDSKMIPESTLLEAVCAVLKTETFDEDLFRARVEQIIARKGNVLQFVFKDGCTQEYIWKDRSRAESWTQEMKEAARLTAARRNSHGG